ncbi:MAG TPA: aromatic amino acid transport family protein [Candidatus Limnocylindrales bacterium]|nr:aromatic amino acid transport family protein [Candidatus Limnocylindrales bacterium]
MSDSILGGIGITRENLLDGMPARRASTILFAIENLTHQLVTRSRRALARYQPAASAQDRERQFIDAVSGGRESSVRPAVQDLERYATEWTPMVPDVADTKAALLHQISTRYQLYYDRVPRIRAALSVDSDAVAQAFQRQQGRDISTAFVTDIDWRQRLRWWRARVSERLETMPPFWMAFSLTLTETVGGGMLAIPIALAWVGVPLGLVLLAVFGFISIMTIAALVEAITRDGSMRYGDGYFGHLIENRLGRPGGVAIGIGLFLLEAVGLLAAGIAFATVLSEQTGVSWLVWLGLLFLVIIFVLRRESLDATIAAALLIGIAILILAAGLIVMGLVNVQPDLLMAPPGGGSLSVAALVFGVLLYVYFGHTSAGNAARQVLRRDPSGRTLLWGNVAAMAVAAVIYVLFVIAVNGSVPAALLASETGTAIGPLEAVAGPAVGWMGALYVILSLGIGSVFGSLGLYLQAKERLGSRVAAGSGPTAKFLVSATPVIGIFVLLVVMLAFGLGSFIGSLNLVGALVLPLLGGVFPMLILVAALHRGERVPGTPLRWLGHPVVVTLIIALYLGAVLAHALFIWEEPVQRLVALGTAVAMVWLIIVSVRRHSFVPRTVVELRADEPPGSGAGVAVVADGREISDRRIADLATQGAVSVDLPPDRPPELFVWAHRPTRDGDSEPLKVDVETDAETGDGLTVRPIDRWAPSTA